MAVLAPDASVADLREADRLPADRLAIGAVPDFDSIYRNEKGRVLGAVRTILGPSDEVEDVVQLAFLEVHRCLPRFEGRSRLGTWVYRIAINVALQHIRKKKRKRWLTLGATGDEAAREPAKGDAARRIEERELLSLVYRAADRLSEKKRTVWMLHELEGMTPHQIAEVLDIPMNTARSRLLAARHDLVAELGKLGVHVPVPGAASEGDPAEGEEG